MPRRIGVGSGGTIFHVLNRGARRARLFESAEDYDGFLRVLCEAQGRIGMRLLCFQVMPNHWHLIVWPLGDKDLSRFMHWLTKTHAQRWQRVRASVGTGAVYQGRYRAIPVQNDRHFLTACGYVERNALRAGIVKLAEDWRWGSAWQGPPREWQPVLTAWPVPRPAAWPEVLNKPGTERHLDRFQESIRRQVPFGERSWGREMAERLEMRRRDRGRPRAKSGSGRINPAE